MTPFDAVQWKNDFIDWVVCEDISFGQATSSRTIDLLKTSGAPAARLLAEHASTVSNWVQDQYQQRLEEVRSLLHSASSKIHLSFDIWSSGVGKDFIGVVGHFVDAQMQLRVCLLGLPPIYGTHSGENMAPALKEVIDRFNISDKLGYFMMDNADSNDNCLKHLHTTVPTIDPVKHRLRCAGHIINYSKVRWISIELTI